MWSVTIERKRDGFKQYVAGSTDIEFSLKSAKSLMKRFKPKNMGGAFVERDGTWENGKVKVSLKNEGDSVTASWSDFEWTEDKL